MAVFRTGKGLARHLRKALDALQAETIITVQSELGSERISPKDTGRFRSSWFVGEGSQSTATAPEGANAANEDAKGLRISSQKTYFLSNNLPYAQAVAVEGRVVSKAPTWFKDFRSVRVPRIQREAAEQVKKEFDL